MNIPISWLKEYVDIPDLKTFTDKMSMIGHMLDKTHEKEGETVIDLELRGNRADCYAILGIAREAHASFGGRFDIPKLTVELPKEHYPDFEVIVQDEGIHRFYSVIIQGVKVGPSPDWMQKRLRDYGLDPINNLVDITNYVMIETGMPMHAFDLNKIGGSKMFLKKAPEGTEFTSFDGTEMKLTAEDLVYMNEKDEILGLLGILGSKHCGIHDDTTDILLECAGIDRTTVRKSMFRHKAMTEAGLRHSHDLHSSYCDYTLPRATGLIMEFANGGNAQITGTHDHYPHPDQPKTISFNPHEVSRLGGVDVPVNEQKEILERLEFKVEEKDGKLEITVPLFRTDVTASEDIVEEVLRIWGYEKIPSKTLSSVIPKPLIQPEVELEEKSRDILVAQGLSEVITVPFVHEPLFDAVHDPLKDRSLAIVNPPTALHTHLRTNMFYEHLDVVHKILGRGDQEAVLFEVGKVYLKKVGNESQPPHKPDFPYLENRQLTAVFASKKKHWDYYHVKGVIENYFDELGVKNVTYNKVNTFPYSTAAEIKQGDIILGTVGKVNTSISRGVFHIDEDVFAFVLDIQAVTDAKKEMKSYVPYSQYPAVTMDMSVLIDTKVQAGDLLSKISEVGGELVRDVKISDVFEKEGQGRSILFSIQYQSKEKNLTTDEVNQLHKKIGEQLQTSFNAAIRGQK
jgi:phenylalanyl-tRNA synthetase beta chain